EPADFVADFGRPFVILPLNRLFHVAAELDQARLGIGRDRRSLGMLAVVARGVVDVDQQRVELGFEMGVIVGAAEPPGVAKLEEADPTDRTFLLFGLGRYFGAAEF